MSNNRRDLKQLTANANNNTFREDAAVTIRKENIFSLKHFVSIKLFRFVISGQQHVIQDIFQWMAIVRSS